MQDVEAVSTGIDFSKVQTLSEEKITGPSVDWVNPEKAAQAFQRQDEILGLLKKANTLICELGKLLIPFRDEKHYLYLGYEYFEEWYQNIGLSR